MSLFLVAYMVLVGALNAAAGRDFHGSSNSKQLNRMLFGFGSALPLAYFHSYLWLGVALFLTLWRVPGLSRCFMAVTGEYSHTPGFAPVDWLVERLWPLKRLDRSKPILVKAYGTLGALVRTLPFFPAGLGYLIAGYISPRQYAVEIAEFIVGCWIGFLLFNLFSVAI